MSRADVRASPRVLALSSAEAAVVFLIVIAAWLAVFSMYDEPRQGLLRLAGGLIGAVSVLTLVGLLPVIAVVYCILLLTPRLAGTEAGVGLLGGSLMGGTLGAAACLLALKSSFSGGVLLPLVVGGSAGALSGFVAVRQVSARLRATGS